MIHPFIIAVFYLAAAGLLIVGRKDDFHWAIAPRLFVAACMVGWAAFYVALEVGGFDFELLRALSRWLHLPTAVSVGLMAAARLYADRQSQ